MTTPRGKHVLHYAVLFSSGLMVMFALSLTFFHQDQQQKFIDHEQQLSERSVADVATQISLYIEKQRRTVSLFGYAHIDELHQLPNNDPNEPHKTALWPRLSNIEPSALNYTLADNSGEVILDDPLKIIGRGCQNDIIFYAHNEYPNDIFVHTNHVIGDHIDVITPLMRDETSPSLFFFVSLNLAELTDLLRLSEAEEHSLMLIDKKGSVQLSSTGRNQEQPLLKDLDTQVLAKTSIPGTGWQVVDTIDKDMYSKHALSLAYTGMGVFGLLSALGLPLLWLVFREEKGRHQAESELITSHNQLEKLLEKRTNALLRSKNDLDYLARYDLLTGLLNRQAFTLAVTEALEQQRTHKRTHSTPSTLCYLDLDQFSMINDMAGHHAGDQLLKQCAEMLQTTLPKSSIISRLSGDHFGIFLPSTTTEDARHMFSMLLHKIQVEALHWEGSEYRISASVGMTSIPPKDTDLQKHLAESDIAIRLSKEKGKGRITVYQDENLTAPIKNGTTEQSLHILNAIKENRLALFQQPIIPLQAERANEQRIEILVRMYGAQGELIPPNDFIPTAEQFGQMPDLDYWVTEHTLMWMNEQEHTPYVHINLSGQSLIGEQCFSRFIDLLNKTPHKTLRHLCFEITETVAVSDYAQAILFIQAVRNLGCSFALDDYGSGVCSFSYLRNLPIDILKIDGELIRSLTEDDVNSAMVASIVSMSKAMKLTCVAEYIEDEQTSQRLKEIGVDYGQGYLFAKPEKLTD